LEKDRFDDLVFFVDTVFLDFGKHVIPALPWFADQTA
jgi:hypothetical protein